MIYKIIAQAPMGASSVNDYLNQSIQAFEKPEPGSPIAEDPSRARLIVAKLQILKGELMRTLDSQRLTQPSKITRTDNIALVVNDYLEGSADVSACRIRVQALLGE